jgi:hypothetical protein
MVFIDDLLPSNCAFVLSTFSAQQTNAAAIL